MKEYNLQAKGTYFLCLFLPFNEQISVGKIGKISFKKGYYLYIGKAFNNGGIYTRIKRHLNKNTVKRWHIDYLKTYTQFKFFGFFENLDIECALANNLKSKFKSVKKFGSSDCSCESHLFYSKDKEEFLQYIKKAGFKPRILFNIN